MSSRSHISSRPGTPPPPTLLTCGWPLEISNSLVAPTWRELVDADGPAEVRMVDVRHAAHGGLRRRTAACTSTTVVAPICGRRSSRSSRPFTWRGLSTTRHRDLFAGDDQELVGGAVTALSPVDAA